MDDDNKPLTMRDHIAMAILTGLIAQDQIGPPNIVSFTGEMRNVWQDINQEDNFTRLVLFSYRLADIVRKIRLTPFD